MDSSLIQKVLLECHLCARFGRARSHPDASAPLMTFFIESVLMDFHQIDRNRSYLHFIDFSELYRAVIVCDKQPETQIRLIDDWMSVFSSS